MMMTTGVQQWAALLAKLIPLVALLSLGLAVGQTYVFQRLIDAETLDPLNYDSPWGQSVIENVYETVYGYEGATILFRPALATGHELSDDGRTHTFRLREGVKFHSGNGFSCKDVDYSLKRALIVDPGFVGQSLIGTATDALTELGEDLTDADYWKRISGSVECLGEYTVAIHSLVPPTVNASMMLNAGEPLETSWQLLYRCRNSKLR